MLVSNRALVPDASRNNQVQHRVVLGLPCLCLLWFYEALDADARGLASGYRDGHTLLLVGALRLFYY